MPTGVRFNKIISNNLPKVLGEIIKVPQQISIWDEEEYSKDSLIEYIGKSEYDTYDKYKITYYIKQPVNGYYKDEKIDSLLAEEERFFYVEPNSKYILVRAPKADSCKIFNLLAESEKIVLRTNTLDLKEFRNKLSLDKTKIKSIVGAWITNLDNVNINTVAIFGDEVDMSDEFDEYTSQEESQISMLIIDFGNETIGITKEYGAIFYNRRSEAKILQGYDIVKNLLQSFDMFLDM